MSTQTDNELDRIANERRILDEREAVVRAFKAGKRIQCRMIGRQHWLDTLTAGWYWSTHEYRVAPEPERVFIGVCGNLERALFNGCSRSVEPYIFAVYATAESVRRLRVPGARIFEVVEALEEAQ